jgi:hypothetical protein
VVTSLSIAKRATAKSAFCARSFIQSPAANAIPTPNTTMTRFLQFYEIAKNTPFLSTENETPLLTILLQTMF